MRCLIIALLCCTGVHTGATPGRLLRNPSTAPKRQAGTTFTADIDQLRALREAGRGSFDIKAGVDRSGFIAHMPGPISQAFYRADRDQHKQSVSVLAALDANLSSKL